MKKIIFTAAILLSCLTVKIASAQVHLSVGVNLGTAPDWGPAGYDRAAYYYMPDIDAYYDVPAHEYVYYNNNVWIHTVNLPPRYHNYDVYHGYKVVVNRPNPWMHHDYYRTHYASYRGRRDQVIIRDRHGVRNDYHGNPGHNDNRGGRGHGDNHGDWGHNDNRGGGGHGNNHGGGEHGDNHGGGDHGDNHGGGDHGGHGHK
jgi:hypothetical protein